VIKEGKSHVLKFQKWALGLELSGITHLLDVPHFERSMYITNCVKTLLSVVHGGYLWLDPPVSIDAMLIHRITELPMIGEDPGHFFVDKKTNRVVAA